MNYCIDNLILSKDFPLLLANNDVTSLYLSEI